MNWLPEVEPHEIEVVESVDIKKAQENDAIIAELCQLFKANPAMLVQRSEQLLENIEEINMNLSKLKGVSAAGDIHVARDS